MRIHALVPLLAGYALAVACSLNPQPLPPDKGDPGRGNESDRPGADPSVSLDASGGGTQGPGDGGHDAFIDGPPAVGDASTDGGADASDAGDAAMDAPDGD